MPLPDATPFAAEVAASGAPTITIGRQSHRGTGGLAVAIVETMPGKMEPFEMEGSFAGSFREGRGLANVA